MFYKDAKKKNVGDWVGSKHVASEDGIITNITQVPGKNELIFTVAFETHGFVEINHRELNQRVLWHGGRGMRDYDEALRCPSVDRLGLTKTTNEDLFKLWGIPNPLP
jgi:hypothetical protein